jgi:hypothetical protein
VGRIATILSFVRALANGAKVSDVKTDSGGGANITAQHFSAPGDDSHPLTTDYAVTVDVPRTGSEAAVGYVDPLNTPKALEGDKRIYARDKGTGAVVVELWLQNDGTAILSNDNGSVTLRPDGGTVTTTPLSTFDAAADGSIAGTNGSGAFELQAGGAFVVNGATIGTDGNLTTASGISVDDHEHVGNLGSPTSKPII